MPVPVVVLALSVVAVPAALFTQGWWTERRLRREQPPRPDPETFAADIAAAPLSRETRALKRLARPAETRADWERLNTEQLGLEHRIERAVRVPQQREPL